MIWASYITMPVLVLTYDMVSLSVSTGGAPTLGWIIGIHGTTPMHYIVVGKRKDTFCKRVRSANCSTRCNIKSGMCSFKHLDFS